MFSKPESEFGAGSYSPNPVARPFGDDAIIPVINYSATFHNKISEFSAFPPDSDLPKNATPRGNRRGEFVARSVVFRSARRDLVLTEHAMEQALYRRQRGDDHAEDRIHTDGEKVIDERVNPGIGEAIIKPGIRKEDRAGYRARDHPQTSRNRCADGQVVREKRRRAEQGERHKIVQNELHGMDDIRTLDNLQERKRECGGVAIERSEIGGVGKDRQHGKQCDRSAKRQGKELEVAEHERERD